MKPKLTKEEASMLAQQHNLLPPKEDKFKEYITGFPTGIASIADIPGQLVNLGMAANRYVGNKLGFPQEPEENIPPYFTNLAREATNKLVGEPQTEVGKRARKAGEFFGGFIGPGGTGVNPAKIGKNLKTAGAKTSEVLTGFKPELYEKFAAAEMVPTVADVTKSRPVKRFQNVLTETPFAAGIMETAGEKRAFDLENKFADIVANSKLVEEAGQLVQQGASKYNKKAIDISTKMYEKAWKGIKNDEMVPLPNTFKAIQEQMHAITPEAKAKLAQSTSGQELLGLAQAIENHNGALPFHDLKKVFKKDIASLVKDWKAVGDSGQGQLKHVGGILDNEMREFTKSKNPAAAKDFARADEFWKKYSERNRKVANKQVGLESPVSSFESVNNALKRGDTRPAKVIMQKLPESEKAELSSTFMYELGREGEEFSPEKWARNFAKLRPESKKVMLSGLDNQHARKLDAISEAMKETKHTRFVGNPSGTEYTRNLMATLMSAPGFVIKSTSGALAAKTMTSPEFIDAMYAASKVKTPAAMQKVMTKFGSILLRENAIKNENTKPKLTQEEALELLKQYE
jgi:hypothetical protein